jgi:parallel beta-helix repeat protein
MDATNLVHDKPLAYHQDTPSVTITSAADYGQIYLYNCSNSFIDDITTQAIYITESNNVTVKNSHILGLLNGFYIINSPNCTLVDINISGNSWNGIIMNDSPETVIRNANIFENAIHGLRIDSSPSCLIDSSWFTHNDENGINIMNAQQVTITNSHFTNNLFYGLSTREVNQLTITGCEFSNNLQTGLSVQEGGFTNITNNMIEHNNYTGIFVGANNSIIKDNVIKNNTNYGLSVGGGSGNDPVHITVFNNTIQDSAYPYGRALTLDHTPTNGGQVNIQNNTISNYYEGISASNGDNLAITYNAITNCTIGIKVDTITNVYINSNQITEVDWGIECWLTTGSITNNYISFYEECIAADEDDGLEIADNTCIDLSPTGLPIEELLIYIAVISIVGVVVISIIFVVRRRRK